MFIKICGITREQDARMAVECGASAVGFVFWPESPRFVDPARARAIIETLPSRVTTVGVFVNQSVEEVNAVADRARLGAVQLHGDETPEFAAEMTRAVIKAVTADAARVNGWPQDITLLVDAHDLVLRGGTGKAADWEAAATLAKRRRVLLAGGLTPENVGQAIAVVRPFGIDVSSGVESAPGVKDHERLKELFEAAMGKK
jgi:phosphoribosylanthranilate isomerase